MLRIILGFLIAWIGLATPITTILFLFFYFSARSENKKALTFLKEGMKQPKAVLDDETPPSRINVFKAFVEKIPSSAHILRVILIVEAVIFVIAVIAYTILEKVLYSVPRA